MSGYSFRRISEHNLQDYISIFSQVFDSVPSKEQVAQKFEYADAQLSYLGFIAYDSKNEAAAFYGVFACKYLIDGILVICAQSGSTMTLESHRGKGLFVKLAQRTYELAQSQGVQFVFGMPNHNSFHGLMNSLKWTFTHRMMAAALFLPSFRLLGFNNSLDVNPYFETKQESELNDRQQFNFFDKLALGSKAALLFQNRALHRPLENYHGKQGFLLARNNVAIWVKMNVNQTVSIGDVFLLPNARPLEIYICFALLYLSCLFKGISRIKFYCSSDNAVAKYFRFPWIKKKSLHFGFFNLGSYPDLPKKLQITYGDYDTF